MTFWGNDEQARRRRLAAPAARRLLAALADQHGGMLAAEAAAAAGLGLSYAKDILAAAQADGLVEATAAPAGRRGRPPMRYRTTAKTAGPPGELAEPAAAST